MQKGVDIISSFRNAVRDSVALIYAKTNQELINGEGPQCIPADAVHSQEFRERVNYFQRTSWSTMLFGPLNEAAEAAPNPVPTAPEPISYDPITFSPLKRNIVSDHHGHVFNDDRVNPAEPGIFYWLRRGNNTCPLNNLPLGEGQLNAHTIG